MLSQTMAREAQKAVSPLAGVADLMVGNDETGVPLSLAKELRDAHIDGVRAVHPLVIGDVGLPLEGNRLLRPRLLGVEDAMLDDDGGQGQRQDWEVRTEFRLNDSDRELTRPEVKTLGGAKFFFDHRYTALVGRELADELKRDLPGFRKSGHFKLLPSVGARESPEVRVWAAGTVTAKGQAAFLGSNTIVLSVEDASEVLYTDPGRKGFVSRIDLALAPDANHDEVLRRVREVVAGRASVLTPQATNEMLQDVTSGMEVGFTLSGAAALVIGLFLVYNALSVSVAERRHDIGVLRSLGATRLQVGALFAGEALFLGLLGALLGIPAGWCMANVAVGPVQEVLSDVFVPLKSHGVPLTIDIVVLALTTGLATSLLAALVPALQAAGEEPADAVRRVPRTGQWLARILQLACSAALIAVGVGAVATREWLPARAGSYGGLILVLVGLLLATPFLALVLSRLMQPLARHFLGLEGRLAADNLARSAGRTGLVIAALAAGVALMMQTAGLTLSTEQAFLRWIDQRILADLLVTSHSPVVTSAKTIMMEDEVGKTIATHPELKDKIGAVVPIRIHQVSYRDRWIMLVAFDAAATFQAISERTGSPGSDLYPRLDREPGSVLVSENFAALYGIRTGDSFSIRGKDGSPVELHVIGTVMDYTWNRGTVMMDSRLYLDKIGDSKVDSFQIFVRRGADEQETKQRAKEVQSFILQKWGAGNSQTDLFVMTRDELRDDIRTLLRRLYAISFGQQLVVGLVAALGVVTALMISVLQRRRELGLLRAVGASRTQVVRSILAEAVLMGVIGSIIGLAVGPPLEWFMLTFILLEETGFVFPFMVPWTAAAVVCGSALVLATLAGILPALRAMRLHIAEAIAYE
jgi:putative ABC transport system permease protein